MFFLLQYLKIKIYLSNSFSFPKSLEPMWRAIIGSAFLRYASNDCNFLLRCFEPFLFWQSSPCTYSHTFCTKIRTDFTSRPGKICVYDSLVISNNSTDNRFLIYFYSWCIHIKLETFNLKSSPLNLDR